MDIYVDKDGNPYRFPVECPHCGGEGLVAPSILQLGFGMLEMGRGQCGVCEEEMFLTLVLDSDNKPHSMIPRKER